MSSGSAFSKADTARVSARIDAAFEAVSRALDEYADAMTPDQREALTAQLADSRTACHAALGR